MGINKDMRLDKNENLYGPSDECREVLKDLKVDDLIYYNRDDILKKRLGEVLGVGGDRVILGYGVEDILKEILMNMICAGDRVMVPEKSWWYYDHLVKVSGGILKKYPVRERRDGYETDIEDIIRHQRETKSKLILIGSPNNPTGHRIDIEGLEKLLSVVVDGVICLDETYWGYGSDTTNDLLRYLDRYDNLIVLRSFSKYYGLAGARIGYGFFGRKTKDRVKMYDKVLGFNKVSERLGLAAIDSRDYYEKISDLIVRDREYLYKGLRDLMNIKVYRSEANFLLMRLQGGLLKEVSKEMDSYNIQIKVFKEEGFKDCIRVSVGRREDNEMMLKLIRSKALEYVYSVKLAGI